MSKKSRRLPSKSLRAACGVDVALVHGQLAARIGMTQPPKTLAEFDDLLAKAKPTLEVASRMIEQTPGITRLMDRLEAKALVRRQRCPKDRRQHLCWITPKGIALLAKLDEPTLRAHEDSMKNLRTKEREAFIRLLDAVRAAHQ